MQIHRNCRPGWHLELPSRQAAGRLGDTRNINPSSIPLVSQLIIKLRNQYIDLAAKKETGDYYFDFLWSILY